MPIKPIKTAVGVTEASGVTRKGNDLLIVSDAAPGAYFSFDVSAASGNPTESNGRYRSGTARTGINALTGGCFFSRKLDRRN